MLSTVNHLNRYLFDLAFVSPAGQLESVRTTGYHKFYRQQDQAWVDAADLQQGDTLQGAHGPLTVASLTRVPGAHRVYNLTVEGEHVYRVSTLGALVHNNGCSKKLRSNLEADGRPPLVDEDAHHIVAGGHPRAQPARDRLAQEGIDIDDARNGVGLPSNSRSPNPDGKAVHSRMHTHANIDTVNDAITGAAPGRAGVVLDDLRGQLEGGGLQ